MPLTKLEVARSHSQEITNAVNELRMQCALIISNNNLFGSIDQQYRLQFEKLKQRRQELGYPEYLRRVDEITATLRVAIDSWKLQDTAKMLEAKRKIETFSV